MRLLLFISAYMLLIFALIAIAIISNMYANNFLLFISCSTIVASIFAPNKIIPIGARYELLISVILSMLLNINYLFYAIAGGGLVMFLYSAGMVFTAFLIFYSMIRIRRRW